LGKRSSHSVGVVKLGGRKAGESKLGTPHGHLNDQEGQSEGKATLQEGRFRGKKKKKQNPTNTL
jgi:hypothetical protein